MRPTVKAMLTHQYVYAYGAVSILDGAFDSVVLPDYSPELNPVEHLCDELREKYFYNQSFDSLDALETSACYRLARSRIRLSAS